MSPTVSRIGPYRFFFYANELGEQPYVHVQRERAVAKFWLEPVALARSRNSPSHELTRIEGLVTEHRETFLEAWNGFSGN
ncbi:DUF4160 domain-containing protein [candidate division GN15 bacterium]|nr:DUF4160 domain-containing protein [candidate division GN15 bacterium]